MTGATSVPEPFEPAADATGTKHPWPALFILLAGTLLSPVDFFIVNTSLPSIQTDLHASAASVQLVVSGYACAYAVLLITGGRLGDMFGRRSIFLIGMIGFAVASIICGLAPTAEVLVGGRIVQGSFAAILMPQSLATIRAVFPEDQRARALGYYAATFGLAAILGQLLGGVLITLNPFNLGWRSIFLVNIPAAAVIVPLALVVVRETRDGAARQLDLIGLILLSAALCALIIPLVEGRELGWPLWTLVLLACTVPILLLFWLHEKRVTAHGGDPLFPPGMFRTSGLRRALMATLLYYSWGAFFLLFALYQQVGLGLTPLQAGLAILPFGLGFACTSLSSATIIEVLGRSAGSVSMIVIALALFSCAGAAMAGLSWLTIVTGAVAGMGQGFGLPALVRFVIDRIDDRLAGLAAGLVNTTLQMSGALSIAAIGGLYYAMLGHDAGPTAVTRAFAVSLLAMGALLLVGAWLIGTVDEKSATTAGEKS